MASLALESSFGRINSPNCTEANNSPPTLPPLTSFFFCNTHAADLRIPSIKAMLKTELLIGLLICFPKVITSIPVTNGLQLHLDASDDSSVSGYPNVAKWKDLSNSG